MAAKLIHKKFVGAYVYAITVDGVVRYIGKGRRYRATEHLRYAKELNLRRGAGGKVKALPFHNKLAKALRNGAVINHEIIVCGLDDDAAYERERQVIASWPSGELWNLHSGGSGGDAALMRRFWADPAYREKTNAARLIAQADPKFRQRQRANAIQQWSDPEKKERHYRQHRQLWDDPEAAAKRRALLKLVWADPEKSARKSALVKSQWTPERKAAMAENRRRAWADPEFKARATASIRASKAKK